MFEKQYFAMGISSVAYMERPAQVYKAMTN